MHSTIALLLDCGGVVTISRGLLACSEVLREILGTASEADHRISTSTTSARVSLLQDKLEDWLLLLPILEAISTTASTAPASIQNPVPAADPGALLSLETALKVLKLADKYNMGAVLELVETFLMKQAYSNAAADSGDLTSIWYWLRNASRLSQRSLLQHYKARIIQQKLVPNSTADVSELHPTDLAELLVTFMQQHAEVRYKCLGCTGRHSTEVRLCSRCSFSPHIRV